MLSLVVSYVLLMSVSVWLSSEGYVFFFQAEDGIRDLVRSRGLGDVYKRQGENLDAGARGVAEDKEMPAGGIHPEAIGDDAVETVETLSLIHI